MNKDMELRKHELGARNSKPRVGGREEEWGKIELEMKIKPDEKH